MGRKLRVDFSNEQGSSGDDNNANTHSNDQQQQHHQNGYAPAAPAAPAAAALPPLPAGKDLPPGASAADEISRTLRTLPPTQLLDILSQMRTLAVSDPARAAELLTQAPQLGYAIFQALLLMDLVSPEAITSVLENPLAAAAQPPAAGYPYAAVAATNTPPVAAPAPVAYAPPPPVAAPPAAAPDVGGQDADTLIKQVMELPQAVIDQLPEAERIQIMALRSQYAGMRR